MELFVQGLLLEMVDVFSVDLTRRTALFKLDRFAASVEDFLNVVLLMKNMGGDLNHLDHEENSVLMRTKNNAFGVALVRAGALTYYDKKGRKKRALAMAAAHGCLLTMEAIAFRDYPGQDYVDRCFHSAALQLSYDRSVVDMSCLLKLVDEYGANVDRCGTLARCVDRNAFVVSTLVQLGADRAARSWDWQRGKLNSPVHRVAECQYVDVYEALVFNLLARDLDLGDEHGCTPLMTLLSETVASEAYISERFAWLMGSGASCLPFDHIGRRVSQTCWGKRQPFKNWIAARVRAENWAKRRVLCFCASAMPRSAMSW